jgi:hypothetical protein
MLLNIFSLAALTVFSKKHYRKGNFLLVNFHNFSFIVS